MLNLDIGQGWTLEVCHNDFFVLNERTRAAGVDTECITVKLAFDSIFIQRTTGKSNKPNELDPFRNMRQRTERAMRRIQNPRLNPEDLIECAMLEVERQMRSRCDAEWVAASALAA